MDTKAYTDTISLLAKSSLLLLEQYDWSSQFEFKEKALHFYPSPDDFNLDRDFDGLLDEFVSFLDNI